MEFSWVVCRSSRFFLVQQNQYQAVNFAYHFLLCLQMLGSDGFLATLRSPMGSLLGISFLEMLSFEIQFVI